MSPVNAIHKSLLGPFKGLERSTNGLPTIVFISQIVLCGWLYDLSLSIEGGGGVQISLYTRP